MIIPIRCYCCNNTIGNKWELFQFYIKNMTNEKALDKLGLKRYCCRRMLLSHKELIDKILDQNEFKESVTSKE